MPISLRFALWTIALAATLATAPTAAHSETPESGATAEAVMARVKAQAASEHKNVLLTFGASWCVNCRLFDKFLADPTIRPIMDKAFVFADLDTGEMEGDKRHANIPGGRQLEDSLGGKGAGYPYIVMLDPSGKRLADSVAPASQGHPGNIGYPVAPYEVDWFLAMLKKAAPSMTEQELATVRNWLTVHAASH